MSKNPPQKIPLHPNFFLHIIHLQGEYYPYNHLAGCQRVKKKSPYVILFIFRPEIYVFIIIFS